MLVVLDGAPDRPYPELGGRTPLEAAWTPVLDALAREGASGFFYPLGPGRVPSTELSHFRLFGYGGYPFPGRACLEALGSGVPAEPGDVFSFLAPRRVERASDGAFYVAGGYGEPPEGTAVLYPALHGWTDEALGYRFEVYPLSNGEAILRIPRDAPDGPSGEITDSDPFFFTGLPVLRPRPLANASRPEAAARTAGALDRFLLEAARMLDVASSETLLVSKWTGTFASVPAFEERSGTRGATVASSRLFRGLARLAGLSFHEEPDDLSRKLDRASELLSSGEAGFVHVHTKAADEAAHAGEVWRKVEALERLDSGLEALLDVPPDRLVACVTSDHGTPVGGRTVHWGDSVPLVVRGPFVRVDGVDSFGERLASRGGIGQLRSDDVLPYLLCQADRAHFVGARPTALEVFGVPRGGEAWIGP